MSTGRDKSNKVVVKSFYGPNISQIKWHVKRDTEENHQNIISNCSTNDINDNSEPQVRVEEIIELTNSITKESNSSVTFSGIVPICGK